MKSLLTMLNFMIAMSLASVCSAQNRQIVRASLANNSSYSNKLSLKQKIKPVKLTYNLQLQNYLRKRLGNSKTDHLAVVALDPKSGAILGSYGRSKELVNPVMHAGYPAASLFKIVTAAAAVDTGNYNSDSVIKYRGGTYTLNRYNFNSNPKKDRLFMRLGEAMGKSCNPIFSRLALNISPSLTSIRAILSDFAYLFNFNTPVSKFVKVPISRAEIPSSSYEIGRTGAGFGKVSISPVHAATIIATIANDGLMTQPYFYESQVGKTLTGMSTSKRSRSVISKDSSTKLKKILKETVVSGTARREFNRKGTPKFSFDIISKTGTLTGSNPKGLTKWFVASGPLKDPKLAIAVVGVGIKGVSDKPTAIGRDIFEFLFPDSSNY